MIDVDSRDSARGLSYLTMISTTRRKGRRRRSFPAGPIYFGEMQDRFVRENGVWKFLEVVARSR